MRRYLWVVEWKSDSLGWFPYHDGYYYSRSGAREAIKRVPRGTLLEYDHRIRKYVSEVE